MLKGSHLGNHRMSSISCAPCTTRKREHSSYCTTYNDWTKVLQKCVAGHSLNSIVELSSSGHYSSYSHIVCINDCFSYMWKLHYYCSYYFLKLPTSKSPYHWQTFSKNLCNIRWLCRLSSNSKRVLGMISEIIILHGSDSQKHGD